MDVEAEVVRRLNSLALGATAYQNVPSDRPASLVVVERTGGGSGRDTVSSPLLDAGCFAPKRPQAAALAKAVEDAVLSMPDALPNVFGATVSSVFRSPPEWGGHGYHVVFELQTSE